MTKAKISISVSLEAYKIIMDMYRTPEFRNKSHVVEYCILKHKEVSK